MHNLRRVAAGLRGEYLEPESTPEPEEGEDALADGVGFAQKSWKKGGKGKSGAGEWVDQAQYELENPGLEVGEVGQRGPMVHEGVEEPDIRATNGDGKKRALDGGEGEGKMSKEARKKAKKERDLQRKRENAVKNAGTDE